MSCGSIIGTLRAWRWSHGEFEIRARVTTDPGFRIQRIRMSLSRELSEPVDLEAGGAHLHLGTDGTGEWILEK